MSRLIIDGGKRLSGTHRVPGNKNAALPMLAAALLTEHPVVLRNLPLIEDVSTMLQILSELGADVSLKGHSVKVCARTIRKRRLPGNLCRRARSSILFAGPMIARCGKVTLCPPGGDVIGRRRLDAHFDGLSQLSVAVKSGASYTLQRRILTGAKVLLEEASVTATENVLMAAVLARGQTTIFNSACEPHVQDLCRLLQKMGARIRGIGTNYLSIEGVDALRGATHRIAPDPIDAASYLAAAAATGGEIRVCDAPLDQLDVVARPFQRLGIRWQTEGKHVVLSARVRPRIRDDVGSAVPSIADGPWPGVPSDLMSVLIVLATQARGTVLFFEKMFESRMYFVDRLIAMGARIVQCDPHRVIVAGPSRLHGTHMSSPDIRAGMGLVIAALAARGPSIIDNAQVIDRGYEDAARELRRLGADITRET